MEMEMRKQEISEMRKNLRDNFVLNQYRKLSPDGFFMKTQACFSSDAYKPGKKKFIENHELYVCEGRVYSGVLINDKKYFFDCITGTIFNAETGKSPNNSIEINVSLMKKDQEIGKKILMSTNGGRNKTDD